MCKNELSNNFVTILEISFNKILVYLLCFRLIFGGSNFTEYLLKLPNLLKKDILNYLKHVLTSDNFFGRPTTDISVESFSQSRFCKNPGFLVKQLLIIELAVC